MYSADCKKRCGYSCELSDALKYCVIEHNVISILYQCETVNRSLIIYINVSVLSDVKSSY